MAGAMAERLADDAQVAASSIAGLIIGRLVSATPCAAALKVAKSARVANSATSETASLFIECVKGGLPRGVCSHRVLASTSTPAALLTAACPCRSNRPFNRPPMPLPLFLPCAAGVEALLAEEVTRLLPGAPLRAARGGVGVAGDPLEVMVLNLESRLAQRVLIEVAEGPYRDENDLYALAQGVAWSDWITPRQTLRVDSTAQRSPLKSLNFAALRVKDAVCDRMRDEHGERPNVDTVRPDLRIVLHVGAERAAVYVDSSGESLFKRGWREDQGDAPLKETLAAAMLAAAGWRGTPSEGGALPRSVLRLGNDRDRGGADRHGPRPGAAAPVRVRAAAAVRDAERRADLQRLKSKAAARVRAPQVPIFASDISFRMVDFARRNAERAGVAEAIVFHGGDALERPPPPCRPSCRAR